MKNEEKIFDVFFNDENDTNCKGFEYTYAECMNYINMYNGTDESYFKDYRGGTVSIYNTVTEEDVYSEPIPKVTFF